MPRPKSVRSSADLAAEIGRPKQEQKRLVLLEDQRRGALLREALSGPRGDRLREALRPIIRERDAALFGFGSERAARAADGSQQAP
jgi:hypothetical protein